MKAVAAVAEVAATRAGGSRAERAGGSQPLLPPTAEHDGTLRRFLEEAVRLFAERGYPGVSIRDIAQPIGVKPSAMYAHFPSKEAVLQEIIDLAHGWFDHEITAAVEAAGPEAPDQLRALVAANIRFHATYPRLATVATYEVRHLVGRAQKRAIEQRLRWEALARRIIEDGVARGDFTCANPSLATRALGAMCIRVSAWIEREDELTVDEIIDTYSDYVLRFVA